MKQLKEEDIKNITVGDIFYKQSGYNPKSKFKVQVVEILNDRKVMVKGMCKSKKVTNKESKPFTTNITSLYCQQRIL